MAASTTAWSPSLFQMRLAFQCRRRSSDIVVRTRVQSVGGRIRVCSVAPVGARNGRGGGVGRRRSGDMSTNSLGDPFAGWTGADCTGPSGEYRRKHWLIEIAGAAVAGVILFAGLTFATLSWSKRNTSRPKQQMELLSAQEELLSASEDDGSCMGVSNDAEAINSFFVQEELRHNLAATDISVASDPIPSSRKLPEYEVINVSSSFTVSDANLSAGEFKGNLVSDSSVSDVTASQEGRPTEGETFDSLLDSCSSSVNHIRGETVNVLVSPEVGAVSNPYILSKDEIKTVTQDFELENILEVSAVTESLEVNNIDESRPSVMTSVAESARLFARQIIDGEDEIDKSRKSYDALKPWNSFSSAAICAPSTVSAAPEVLPGKVLVPASVDQIQWQALAALQILKVIEDDVQPSDLCTRREYARWLVSASGALSRSAVSKLYPAMYIENFTELAFDDVTPEDPDFSSIQGLAEAGLISSKLSRRDMLCSLNEDQSPFCFSPESPLSRQDLVSWKMALERRHLPEADRKILHQLSGFIDIDKINPDACPAIIADLSAGQQGITALAFGYTKLFQPDKPVSKAQAAIALATGEASDIVNEELARIEADSMAENAIAEHSALVAEVEKDINASFEKKLSMEREKISAVEKLAEEAKRELERLRAQRDEDNIALMKEHEAVESEMEVFSRLRHEVEEQFQSLMNNKVEMSYEKERISKLREDVENENQEIARLHYELDVERKALSMARTWAEDEAKRAREQAKALEEARDRWQRHGIKVIVDSDLQEEASTEVTWLEVEKRFSVKGTVNRAENLVHKLKVMAGNVGGESKHIIDTIIQRILVLVSSLREWTMNVRRETDEIKDATIVKVMASAKELQQSASEFNSTLKEKAKRVAGDCREGIEKLTHKFKI